MKLGTEYLVYVQWPEGPGGAYTFKSLPDAELEAQSQAIKYQGVKRAEVVLLKVTRKKLEF